MQDRPSVLEVSGRAKKEAACGTLEMGRLRVASPGYMELYALGKEERGRILEGASGYCTALY